MSLSSSENEDLEQNEGSSDEQEVPTGDDDSDAGEEVQAAAEEDTDDEMTVCDDGTHDSDEEPEGQEPDVNASATESDEDDDEELDDDEDVPTPKKQQGQKVKTPNPTADKIARITKTVKDRYEKRQGLQLYIRFPQKLPEDKAEFQKLVKSLSELIVEGHKPRQKHARFCLVDFASTEDRDIALKKLNKTQPQTKIVVSLPKTDSEEFIQTLIEKKLKQDYKKREKQILRLESRKTVNEKEFTPTIRVMNIPKSASAAEIKALFPNAVDIQTKPAANKFDGKSVAIINLPSSTDAKKNVKRKLELGGNKLTIKFNLEKKKRKRKNKPKPSGKPKKGPNAPPTPAKRSTTENEDTKVAAKKAKTEVSAKGAKNGQQGGKGKGKKPFPPNKGNPAPNKKPGGKPNKQNKQKKQPQKKAKGVVASAAE